MLQHQLSSEWNVLFFETNTLVTTFCIYVLSYDDSYIISGRWAHKQVRISIIVTPCLIYTLYTFASIDFSKASENNNKEAYVIHTHLVANVMVPMKRLSNERHRREIIFRQTHSAHNPMNI